MHSFLRAIGFSKIKKKKDMDHLIEEIIKYPTRLEISKDSNGNEFAEISKEFGGCIGITLCGEYLEDDSFHMEYYYPYFCGSHNKTNVGIEIEKHSEKESYAGICDEINLGVSLIFYLQNVSEFLKESQRDVKKLEMQTATLSALSLEGKILLPIKKSESQIKNTKLNSQNRNHLIAAARNGDEEAIESLTLEDIDIYSKISKRIVQEDILTIVDSYFMPFGIESDQYSVLGEISDFGLVKNKITQEDVYILKINSNDVIFDLCINKHDLMGEPVVGRRFKGNIWLQGRINYQEE